MIYSIFMRKIQGDANPFPTTIVVQQYINNFVKNNDIVISCPGYMSTTDVTINDFLSNINFPNNTYFTEGMNGNRVLRTTGLRIQDEHNKNFTFNVSGICPRQRDHAKMIFFFENNDPKTTWDISELLELKVKAILLGSSNQSNTTYFNATADKGEADIFLFDGRYLMHPNTQWKEDKEETEAVGFYKNVLSNAKEYIEPNDGFEMDDEDNPSNKIALFKELASPKELLNNIFKDTIS